MAAFYNLAMRRSVKTALLMAVVALVIPGIASEPAQAPAPEHWAGRTEMNGLKFATYKGFWEDWKLLTVRYRLDNREQRFVYANAKALKALKERTPYPDGAAFGKIGFSSMGDPAFESSLEPRHVNRMQIMLKDSGKFKETDGWGYALFDGTGRTFAEDPAKTTIACHACHKLVPDRDFVFSRSVNYFGSLQPEESVFRAGLPFEDVKVAELPERLKKKIPKQYISARSLGGMIRKFLFQGTLDEIRPALINQALEKGTPALLMSEDGSRFTAVWKVEKKKSCPPGSDGTELVIFQTLLDNQGREQLHESSFCAPREKK